MKQPDTLSLGLNLTGTARMMAGEIDDGIALLRQSLEVATSTSSSTRIANAHWMLGIGPCRDARVRARRALRCGEHIAFAEEHDLDCDYTSAWLAAVHLYRGRWDEASSLARRLVAGTPLP